MKINNKGFSLVELLAVVAILAVLVTVGISAYSKYVEDSKRTMYAKMAKDYINEARVQISSKEIKMLIQDKKVKISGLDLKIIKCSKQEILITGTLGGIIYE